MNLIIFFALPLATILLSIVLQKILKSPLLVAITFFAIYLLAAFILAALGIIDLGLALVATIIYTIIAFITAYAVMLICNIIKKLRRICCCNCNCNNQNNENDCNDQTNNVAVQGVLSVQDVNGNNDDDDNDNDNCGCRNNQVAIRASVTPNTSNGGRTGNFRGCYRRCR